MTVVNGLGATITVLLYNDGVMMYHLSGAGAAGRPGHDDSRGRRGP